jgi:ATP-dependent RNA helicase DHX37/DHR1
MEEIHKLRAQLSNIANANFQNAEVGFNKNIRPPNDTQVIGALFMLSTFDDTIL